MLAESRQMQREGKLARVGPPRARAAASCLVATPPREVGPALPGRRIAPTSAASLSFSARPPPPPAPLQARGGVALPVEGRGGPVATAAGLPPVSPYVPTPLSEAALAHLSPPPTTDPKPPLGPSGLGLPARRRVRYRIAATPLPPPLLSRVLQSPAGRFRIPQVISSGSIRWRPRRRRWWRRWQGPLASLSMITH